MTTKYGMFKEHVYLKPGGVPVGLESTTGTAEGAPAEGHPEERDGGLNMKVTVGKSGKGNDATFGKFISLYQGDKFIDPLKARLQSQAESTKHNVVDKPWKAASTIKKHATPGDFYGTSGKVPYMPPFPEAKKTRADIKEVPKGIYTSPAKKGSFGFDKLTLSQRAGPKGIATEYEYQHDPLGLQDQRRKEEREADHKARVTDKPFKPAAPPKRGGYGVPNTTISKGKGVVGEWEYVTKPVDPNDLVKTKHKGSDAAAFKPTNVFASQRMQHIPYIHDPEVPKLQAEAERKMREHKMLAEKGAWKPTQSNKTDMVRSIVRMNLR